MKRFLHITVTGVILFVVLSIGLVYIKGYDKPYVLGEIIVGLKSSDTKDKMSEFIRAHPEISIRRENLSSIPFYATLGLKPYSEWQRKVVISSQNKDPQMRSDILKGYALIRNEYEKLKSDPSLLHSNMTSLTYHDLNPEMSNFPTIFIAFKRGLPQEERENFFQRYSQLEIVKYEDESTSYLVRVPKRKEQYWINEFMKQDFVKYAEFNSISHISSKFSTRRIKRMFEILIIEKLFGVSLPSW